MRRAFYDLDESIISSSTREPKQKHHRFALENGGIYYTIIRPCAKEIINYGRTLFGLNNVYILTSATKDYALEINRLGEFGFPDSHVFAREDLAAHYYPTAYGGGSNLPHELASVDNLLVDNLPPRENTEKIAFLGIWKTLDENYLKVQDYYGDNSTDALFAEKVIQFLDQRHAAPLLCKQESEEESLEVSAGE